MQRVVNLKREKSDAFRAVSRSGQITMVEAGAYEHPDTAVGASPMEVLLVGLAGCSAATLEAVIVKMRHSVRQLRVVVEADRAERVPRIWTSIRLTYILESSLVRERVSRAIAVTERTCSASAMLAQSCPIAARAITLEVVDPELTRPLRQRLLRPHQNLDELRVGGEDDEAAVWFAAILEGEVVGTAGVVRQSTPSGFDGWRVRAMAVDDAVKGMGVGSDLLEACLRTAVAGMAEVVWCSSRVAAAGFYRARGFRAVSDEYDEPEIGPHITMEWHPPGETDSGVSAR